MTDEANDDLRGQLEAAFNGEETHDDVEVETTPEVDDAPWEDRARDERGRFVAKQDEVSEAPEQPEQQEQPEEQPPPEEQPEAALAPPNGWSADAKGKWHELPPEVQQAALKREEDIAKFTSQRDEHASFGKTMYQTIQPYMAQIQAEGGTPETAIQSLLNTAYLLRTGTADQKRQLLLQTAQQFGVDMTGVSQQEQQDVPPYVKQLTNEVSSLKQLLAQQEQQTSHQLQSEIQSEIEAFAADPKNQYFEEVKGHMAALISSGAAKDLQDAYEQAVWASPDIRATLQAQQKAEEEQKRKSEAARRAQEAKRKSISLTGGPGNTAGKSAPEERSLREELESNWAAQSGAV